MLIVLLFLNVDGVCICLFVRGRVGDGGGCWELCYACVVCVCFVCFDCCIVCLLVVIGVVVLMCSCF